MRDHQGPQITPYGQKGHPEQKTPYSDLEHPCGPLAEVDKPKDNRADDQGDHPGESCLLALKIDEPLHQVTAEQKLFHESSRKPDSDHVDDQVGRIAA